MKSIRKLLGTFLLTAGLVFACCLTASADEYAPAVFKTTPFEATQNGTVSTVLYLEENSNLIDFEFQLGYDTESVELISAVEASDLVGDMEITSKEGAVHISYTRTSTNLTKKTQLAVLTFLVNENVGPNSYDFLSLDKSYQSEAHTMMDEELYALPVETQFEPLNIYNFGDVNLSHSVSIADVTYLRQHLAEIRTLSDYQLGLADAYYDTEVTIADAVRIQQYLANKSMLMGNRVNVTFMDKEQKVYRVKSVLLGGSLSTIPAIPAYSGYYGGVWSTDPSKVVGTDFQDLQAGLNVYAVYKKDASEAVTFYKERLTDVYYAQDTLTGNLNLVNKLTWQDGYTADIYWSSSNSAVLNASTGAFNKPAFDSTVTLTATIISYQDGSIEAQDYIAFEYKAEGEFLCPSKEEIRGYLSGLFTETVDYNMTLPGKVTNADMGRQDRFEVRLEWIQRNSDGTEHSVVQLERANEEQTVTLIAVITFNGVPLEDDGKIYFDDVVLSAVSMDEVRSYIINQIAANTGLTVTEGTEFWDDDAKYNSTVTWTSENTAVADIEDNKIFIKDVVNGTALPVKVEVTYACGDEPEDVRNFKLAYTVNVVTSNTTLVPGTNIDPVLYDALKAATGVYGNLTTDALKDVKFVYLDLSDYPDIEDLTALTYCTNLRVLDISGLQIDETSLNQIATLTKLEALIANNCGITSMSSGGVPVLDKMINLQMLDLANNKLTSLDSVFSRENRYGQLLELYLDDNLLTDISALCEVTENTVELKDEDGNVVTSYTENVITNRAPMLRFLTLDNNFLEDEDLVAFGNFKVLKYLSLGNNDLTTVSPLKDIRTLLELHLQGNRIEDVRDLRYLQHLQSLYLSHNQLRNVFSGAKEVNISYLKYLTDLEILYLNDNYIEDISDLNGLYELKVLNVNNNRLQDLSVLADKGKNMVELYAENNEIDSFSFLRELTGLTRLMLSGNGSVYESALNGYLSGLTELRTLTLSGKDLRSLSFLSAMPKLVRLDVAGCNLPSYCITASSLTDGEMAVSEYQDNVAAISALKSSLKYLDVSNNGLAYTAEAMEAYFSANGEDVEIDSIEFAGAVPESFESLYEMTNLKVLYADNLAQSVDADTLFSVMTNLRYLSMENCGITETDWLAKFRNLVYVDLAGNNLKSFDMGNDISVRSRGTLEYLYVDSAVEGAFADAYGDFDDNVLKEFSASNLQIGVMDYLPDMPQLTYLNLANSGITDLSGDPEFAGWFDLSRYQTVETLDLTGVQTNLERVLELKNLKTLYAIGDVEDAVFQKDNLHTLFQLNDDGVACYLYGYDARYIPKAEREGALILGKLEDYSREITVAANNVLSNNNPVLAESVNGFDITWTVSNPDNYAVVDNKLAVVDYTNLVDETLILTASIDVYPGQESVTRDFEMDMTVLRADDMKYLNIDAVDADEYLTRGDTFTYGVSLVPAAADGFSKPVRPVGELAKTLSVHPDGGTETIPWGNVITESGGNTYTVKENTPLGAVLRIAVSVQHEEDGKTCVDLGYTKEITITDRTFNLTLVPNGGTIIDEDGGSKEVRAFPEEAVLFETFRVERVGYLFDGWYTDAACTQRFWAEGMEKPVMPSYDLTLYAKWTAHSFNVDFDANGGDVSITSKGVLVGREYGELPVPTRTGYTFLGWYTAAEGGSKVTGDMVVEIEADQTLYAQWQINRYVLSLYRVEGELYTSKNVTYGESYGIGSIPDPVRTGFVFNGWYTASDGGSKVTDSNLYTRTSDQALYAHWTPNSYTVSWSEGTGSTIRVKRTSSPYAGAATGTLGSGDTVYHGDVLSISYSAATGYSLSGYGAKQITVSGNVTSADIYATATPNSYTYTISYQSSNGTDLGNTTVTNKFGTTNKITPTSFTGYTTPTAQSVAWDATSKTVTFIYVPETVKHTVINGTFCKSPLMYYTTAVHHQNRTSDSVQIRVKWIDGIEIGGRNQYAQKVTLWINSKNAGTLTVVPFDTWASTSSEYRSLSKWSEWITVPVDATTTSISVRAYRFQTNYNGTDMVAYDYATLDKTWTIPIPTY